jgi:hypothetical protein
MSGDEINSNNNNSSNGSSSNNVMSGNESYSRSRCGRPVSTEPSGENIVSIGRVTLSNVEEEEEEESKDDETEEDYEEASYKSYKSYTFYKTVFGEEQYEELIIGKFPKTRTTHNNDNPCNICTGLKDHSMKYIYLKCICKSMSCKFGYFN